jgi:hypothetical protein
LAQKILFKYCTIKDITCALLPIPKADISTPDPVPLTVGDIDFRSMTEYRLCELIVECIQRDAGFKKSALKYIRSPDIPPSEDKRKNIETILKCLGEVRELTEGTPKEKETEDILSALIDFAQQQSDSDLRLSAFIILKELKLPSEGLLVVSKIIIEMLQHGRLAGLCNLVGPNITKFLVGEDKQIAIDLLKSYLVSPQSHPTLSDCNNSIHPALYLFAKFGIEDSVLDIILQMIIKIYHVLLDSPRDTPSREYIKLLLEYLRYLQEFPLQFPRDYKQYKKIIEVLQPLLMSEKTWHQMKSKRGIIICVVQRFKLWLHYK